MLKMGFLIFIRLHKLLRPLEDNFFVPVQVQIPVDEFKTFLGLFALSLLCGRILHSSDFNCCIRITPLPSFHYDMVCNRPENSTTVSRYLQVVFDYRLVACKFNTKNILSDKEFHLYQGINILDITLFLIQSMGCLIMCTHYSVYGIDGVGLPGNKLLGRILESAADITLVLLLILLAKGYTVTRARLRQASSIKVTMFMCTYCVTYVCLFIYEQIYFDPGEVLYIYQSTAGYGLVLLRGIGWVMFIYSTFFTLKHYPDKGGFYYPFFCFYTLWFCAGPCIILISNYIISEWVRAKVSWQIIAHYVTYSFP